MQIMASVKTILVATDFSEASAAALAYGHELAHALGSSLHVLHVVGNVVAGAVGIEGYTIDYVTLQREVEPRGSQAPRYNRDRGRSASAGCQDLCVTSNTPAQSIVSYAKDAGIDLVIVGTHGRGGIEHFAIGSVAERVVRLAPCPVLTIRHPAHQRMLAEARQIAAQA